MSSVGEQVSQYWNKASERFDSRASHIRHAEIWRDVLREAFGPGGPRDVLDLGTGTGACAVISAELGHRVTAVDGSPGMLAVARSAAQARGLDIGFIEAEMDAAGLPAQSIDIVTFRNVLWTVADPQAAVALAAKLLRPGGRIVVSDGLWKESSDRSDYGADLAGQLPLHRGLAEDEAKALLRAEGFSRFESWAHLFPENPYEAMGSPPFFLISAIKD